MGFVHWARAHFPDHGARKKGNSFPTKKAPKKKAVGNQFATNLQQ
jgi:hypothetical protein